MFLFFPSKGLWFLSNYTDHQSTIHQVGLYSISLPLLHFHPCPNTSELLWCYLVLPIYLSHIDEHLPQLISPLAMQKEKIYCLCLFFTQKTSRFVFLLYAFTWVMLPFVWCTNFRKCQGFLFIILVVLASFISGLFSYNFKAGFALFLKWNWATSHEVHV